MKAPAWGTELDFDDAGNASAVPLILIHAFPFHRGMWAPQAPLGERARLISYDVRGFGRSLGGDGQSPFELFVEDLLALMDHLRLPNAVLCGLSMGGYIALRAAERAPHRVRALLLADTKSEADTDEAKLQRARSVLAIKRDGLRSFADGFLSAALAPETQSRRPEIVAQARALIADNSAAGVCAALLAMAGRTDTTRALPTIQAPALVMAGEHDAFTPPAAARTLAAALPRAGFQVIPAAGHLSNLENPEAFNSAVTAFLKTIAPV